MFTLIFCKDSSYDIRYGTTRLAESISFRIFSRSRRMEGMILRLALHLNHLKVLFHLLSAVARLWTVPVKSGSMDGLRCSPILPGSGQVKNARPERDSVIHWLPADSRHSGLIWEQLCEFSKESHIVSWPKHSGLAVSDSTKNALN